MLEPGRYLICDIETSIHKARKWTASPFAKNEDGSWANGLYYIGWRRWDEDKNGVLYTTERPGLKRELPAGLLDGIDVLVGHNWCGYDQMWFWHDPQMWEFLKRGGRIHDTAYAQYMIKAQHPKWVYPSLNDTAVEYGGQVKVDAVKACWEQGIDTPDIPHELMLEYLIGNDEHPGDIGNTRLAYLGQINKLNKLKLGKAFLLRSDGLLFASMCMFNGIRIDMQRGEELLATQLAEQARLEQVLKDSLPADLPPELEWTWSPNQKAAILFGGALKYTKRGPILDEAGQPTFTKAKETRYLYNGRPVPPELMLPDKEGHFHSPKTGLTYECDMFKSGKKEGAYKTKQVEVQGKPKTKLYDHIYTLPRMVTPLDEWATKKTDANGNPVYSTGKDVVEALERYDLQFVKDFVRYSALGKEITTYLRGVDKQGNPCGMLSLVQPWDGILHHKLNGTSTVTLRYSSSDPNCQNIPRKDKSEVKKLFISRFKDGLLIENDYSQLEVVAQAMLTKDKNLIRDVCNRVDFHCKRVAMQHNVSYEEALKRCKDEDFPDHETWSVYRTLCKIFSFQRAYGAGAKKIATYTGLSEDAVKVMIENEEREYPGTVQFYKDVRAACEKTAVQFYDPADHKVYRRGWWQSPFGSLYTFRTYDAPAYKKRQGVEDDWMPTEQKNYGIQGEGGFVVQCQQGKLVRHFIEMDNYSEEGDFRKPGALLFNTVHDCNQADAKRHLAYRVAMDMKRIMEEFPKTAKEVYGIDVPVPFPADSEIGENLWDLHKADNYRGE